MSEAERDWNHLAVVTFTGSSGGSGGRISPILVPWRGAVQCQQRFRSWHRRSWRQPHGSQLRYTCRDCLPNSSLPQLSLLIYHVERCKRPKGCRGQLRSLCTHCSHRDMLCIHEWPETECVNQRKGFSCISSNSHKVIPHGYGQQETGFGASAAKILNLFFSQGSSEIAEQEKQMGHQPQETWCRRPVEAAETAGCSTHNAAHIKLSAETAAFWGL